MSRMIAGLVLAGGLIAAGLPFTPAKACDRAEVVRIVRTERVIRLASDTVLRRDADIYRVRIGGGERVRLAARGNGNLALRVRDACGHVIAVADDEDNLPVLVLRSNRAAVFTVEVVNRDCEDVDYVLTAQ